MAGNALSVGVAARPCEVGEVGEVGGQPGLTRTDRVVPNTEGGWDRVGAGEGQGRPGGRPGQRGAGHRGAALPFPSPRRGMLPWPFPRWDAGEEQAPEEQGPSPFGDPGKVWNSGEKALGEPGTPPPDR